MEEVNEEISSGQTDYDDGTVYNYNYYDNSDHYNCNNPDEQMSFSCDTCDREFVDRNGYEKHMSEHITCKMDGCTFTAHQKLVDKHITMQHSTGLYEKIRNVSTPEDVKKWIEDRKRRYPSRENIEKRRLQQEKLLERGERLTASTGRFGEKDRTRLQKPRNSTNIDRKVKRAPKRRKRFVPKLKKESLIDDKCDWNGTMFPFRGTSSLLLVAEEKFNEDFDDTEWAEEKSSKDNPNSKIILTNALGALMGAYNSSGESDEEQLPPRTSKTEKVEIVDETNDDNATPTEQEVMREVPDGILIDEDNHQQNDVISGLRKRRRTRSRKRRNVNKVATDNTVQKDVPFLQRSFKKRRRTLLEGLLANDIRHERNVILQCVRYVVKSNFFDTSH